MMPLTQIFVFADINLFTERQNAIIFSWKYQTKDMFCSLKPLENYRKRPCISRTFFHKIEAKNRRCGLSMDTSMFGVLKNLLNIHKTS